MEFYVHRILPLISQSRKKISTQGSILSLIMDSSCMEHDKLLEKQATLQTQLLEFGGWSKLPLPEEVPIIPSAQKPNTCHWDYVMKEMEWLANDFQKERGRHSSNAKKITKGVETYAKTREIKRAKKAKVHILHHYI